MNLKSDALSDLSQTACLEIAFWPLLGTKWCHYDYTFKENNNSVKIHDIIISQYHKHFV